MFDSHDRVLEKLAASGGKEFSLDTLKAVMEEVWQEGAARHEEYEKVITEREKTAEQEEVHEYFVTFMKENNNQGFELTEEDLLVSFRQAQKDTGYFAEEPEQPKNLFNREQGILSPAPTTPEMER